MPSFIAAGIIGEYNIYVVGCWNDCSATAGVSRS